MHILVQFDLIFSKKNLERGYSLHLKPFLKIQNSLGDNSTIIFLSTKIAQKTEFLKPHFIKNCVELIKNGLGCKT